MPDQLLISVEKYLLAQLEAKGFKRTEYNYAPEHFGNSHMLYTSEHYWIEVWQEKSQVFVNVGPAGSQRTSQVFHDLWYVAEFLKHDGFPRDYSGSTDEQVARIAQYLLAHWDAIFTPDLLTTRLQELQDFIRARQRAYWDEMK